ncbi:uncharacterized protein LOC120134610 [Hibiscus syriacus]|uniref:uncharacterized protein LOC120134610 n=1 Tax=Hibiscus syriacus TaxID=106335 RepID=UPI001924D81C|nr:uncharacterized protein LOC120134610 [Hibiscus syriacus]
MVEAVVVPAKTGGPARVYVIREPQDRVPTDVIIGTFLLESFLLLALIDSSSSHSYILGSLANRLSVPVCVKSVGLVVTGALGERAFVDCVNHMCHLVVQGEVFPVDLMELSFHGFDVILGTDWLRDHHIHLDFELSR